MFEKSAGRLLLNRRRLRRLRRSIPRDIDEFVVDVGTDSERMSLVDDPFDSMDDVLERLQKLETRLLEQSDRRGVFLTVYSEMTTETIREIRDDEFNDSAWMQRYLIRFANYYRRAFRHYERGEFELVPDPWIVAFGAALRGETLVTQDALLGINAHINYDLALTLSDIGIDPDRADKYADHSRINEILERLVSVQQELLARRYAPGLSRIGDQLGELDDLTASLGFQTAREGAWQIAVVRADARWLPVDRYSRWLLRESATGAAHLLLRPQTSPSTTAALQRIEADELDLLSYAQDFHERVQRDY